MSGLECRSCGARFAHGPAARLHRCAASVPVNPWSVPVVVASAALDRTACGYVCKRCGGPSPQGVGYAAPGVEAAAASAGLTRPRYSSSDSGSGDAERITWRCACGYSVHADYLEEGGQR